jgi:hypothetical protein
MSPLGLPASGRRTRLGDGRMPQSIEGFLSVTRPAGPASLPDVLPATEASSREIELDEADRVLLWRISRLVEAGYDDVAAVELGLSRIDLHRAVDLLERGCPYELAVRILV